MTSWQHKKVLVTGAEGFIGSHLVERLVAEGAEVRAFVLYNSFARWGWLEEPHVPRSTRRAIELFPGDIRDPGRVREAVRGREFVFHLASLIAIPYSYLAPDSFVETNVLGALNVLNACRAEGTARLVHTSTSEVYGTARRVPIDEEHALQPQSPYAASKVGADVLAASYHRSFDTPVVIVRPFNTYGPRQSARAVIPTVLAQLHAGARHIRLGSLTPTRDFNFVTDTVSGFLHAAACDRAVGHVVNVATGTEVAVGDLVRLACELSGREAEIEHDHDRLRPESSEVERLCGDASRLREWTGWVPLVSLREGLERTSAWVAANLDQFKPDEYTV
ncbi:MAG: GDP-mannose 4,6-dehydratase [Deltaproteobacteria bacterium]|nr:GDP-mannose 4,6-dehydratase [Deltaproteobacteria bacterium]